MNRSRRLEDELAAEALRYDQEKSKRVPIHDAMNYDELPCDGDDDDCEE